MGDAAKTFYEILGIPLDASQAAISTAFRELVKHNHPDRFTEPVEKAAAEKLLKEITEAYNTLGKPKLRFEYDKSLLTSQSTTVVKSQQVQAKDLVQQGKAKYKASDFQSALAIFDHVLRVEPENSEALFYAGMVRLMNPRWRSQGSFQVEKAIDLEPYNPTYVVEYAEFLMENGLAIRARKLLDTAVNNFKTDPLIHELAAKARGEKPGSFSLFGKRK